MKGTPSQGKKSGRSNMVNCRRCGRKTFHVRKKKCAACGYGSTAKLRTYTWMKKD